MGCGCNKNVGSAPAMSASPMSSVLMQTELSNKPDFKKVIYNGPNYTHLIPSRTGVIAKLGMRDYGTGKKGSVIFVHLQDIAAFPELYQLIEEPEVNKQKVVETVAPTVEETVAEVPEISDEEDLQSDEEVEGEYDEDSVSILEPIKDSIIAPKRKKSTGKK